ncbi:hypothetical protein SAMN05216436_109118 [bacterium A37T11]|nr:hypothetical protein SAMN05216436_109118 [bacterium A37T11]
MTFCAFTAKPLNTRGSGNKSNHKLDTLQLQRTGVHLQTDDSHTETCKIFPKEVFSFLPDSGFKGYDDTVWIKLRIRKQSQSRDSSQINSNVNFTLQRVTVEKQAQKIGS